MYYDKNTIDEYKSIIRGQRHLEVEEYQISNDKDANIGLKLASTEIKASKSYKARVVESMLYDCDEFERMLEGRDDFFDFTRESGLDIETVTKRSIIKINAFLEIPDGFDLMRLIDTFKPLLLDSIENGSSEKANNEAVRTIFGNAKATKIPVIADAENYLLCSKLYQNCLISEYEEYEELDEEVTLLARLASDVIDRTKAFYDPLKDFLTMNRVLRRSMNDRGKELTPITVDKEYRKIDILAIYR